MKFGIYEEDGKKTYMVNDIRYSSLEEVPPQYRNLFEDKNKDGIPDGFEMPLDMSSPWAMIKSMFSSGKHDMRGVQPANVVEPNQEHGKRRKAYDRGNEPTLASTIVKIIVVSILVFAGYWLYNVYMNPSSNSDGQETEEQVVTDEVTEEPIGDVPIVEEPVEEGDAAPVDDPRDGNEITVTLEDPNVAPYHMFISFQINNQELFRMDPPESPMQLSDIESMTELQFFSNGINGTNLNGKSITFNVYASPCELDPNYDWATLTLNQIPFQKSYYEDGAAGHTYKNYFYQLSYRGKCIKFSILYNLVNPGIVEGSLKDFDVDSDVKLFEKKLAQIELQ